MKGRVFVGFLILTLFSLLSQVRCFITDSEHTHQNCSAPHCPPSKAIDFSLDNDFSPDVNNSYTHASLQKENLPPSFTICTAFMVEAWTDALCAPT